MRRSRRWRGHRDDREQMELVEFQPGIHYKFYYSQDESDQGVIMETNLPTKDVSIEHFICRQTSLSAALPRLW